MANIKNMPIAGIAVIIAIAALFILSVIILFHTFNRYRRLTNRIGTGTEKASEYLRYATKQFTDAYESNGSATNTPAIVEDAVNTKLGGLQLCERFLNNAVSLFVTLGLFGTFLGLSLSVSSLTELISYSNTSEWLSVLDSVGGGLMSALGGMGVAFYTSLVGVACSIILTILRSIFSPASAREVMETRTELWLDQSLAPTLPTQLGNSDAELIHQMVGALNSSSSAMEKSLNDATDRLTANLVSFSKTVDAFNKGTHDFSEIEYSLQGSIERLDLSVRDFSNALRSITRRDERSDS